MKASILIILVLFCSRINAQTDSMNSVTAAETTRFISTIRNDEIKQDSFLLLEESASIDVERIRFYIKNEKDIFPQQDTVFMINQANKYAKLRWDSTWIKNAVFLKKSELNQLIKRTKNGTDWQLFYEKYGQRYYWLSFPVFSVDYKYCIVEIGYACGDLCAEGKVMIFIRQGETWKRLKVLEQWIS